MAEQSPDFPKLFYSANTSQGVLDSPPWADPVDPREIKDLDTRSSLYPFPLDFDEFGRPINPWVNPDELNRLGENRGDLGKWGVNSAADPIVIAESYDKTAKTTELSLLLIKRKDGQWAFPGGMVDPGEIASAAAKRELKEEVGVELDKVKATTVYSGYADDPRNTKNAWIETTASLMVIDFKPQPKADDQEVSDARWFNLESVKQLLEQTGGLYANHAEILQSALNQLFTDKMRHAQELFGQGKFIESQKLYNGARTLAPDGFEEARALRGEAACADKCQSPNEAFELAKKAYDKYSQLLEEPTSKFTEIAVRREVAQSATLLGTIALREVIDGEYHKFDSKARYQADALHYLGEAHRQLRINERLRINEGQNQGELDQYTINLMARLSIANSLFGNRKIGRIQAWRALAISRMSESPKLSAAANISRWGRGLAKGRAVIRGAGAVTVSQAVRVNRRLALNVSRRLI